MPKGPQGQKRPSDLIGCVVMVAKIATGEAEESPAPSIKVNPGALVPPRAPQNSAKRSVQPSPKRRRRDDGVEIEQRTREISIIATSAV
jgi:hypothetical protein